MNLTFAVTLSEFASGPVEVPFTTSVGTAGAEDFEQVSGTATFADGTDLANVTVPTTEDAIDEFDETFAIELSSSSTAIASPTAGSATGTIDDDDPPPVFSIADATGTEGDPVGFTVTLTGATERPTVVRVATSDGTAAAPSDYAAITGTVTFAPGETSKTFAVPTVGDDIDELDEVFTSALLDPSNATIDPTADTASATIEDDDLPPVFSIEGSIATEGDPVRFTITQTGESDRSTEVSYSTGDYTATAPADYAARSATATFAPGETSKSFDVPTAEDGVDEANEFFTAALSNPANATIDPTADMGTSAIEDDDDPPVFSLSGGSADEGDPVSFTITRTGETERTTRVHYYTDYIALANTANEPADYTRTEATIEFGPSETSKSFEVTTVEDDVDEIDEAFIVALSSPPNNANATIDPAQQSKWGTIEDDDPEPVFSIAGGSATEGDPVGFTVTRTGATERPTSVRVATSDWTATAPSDYDARSVTVDFAPGEASKSFEVTAADDDLDELEETFTAALSDPVNATIEPTADTASATIEDADLPPVFSIADATADEGDPVGFTITRTGGSDRTTSVSYSTSDGTAVAPGDYAARTGTIDFAPGESSKSFEVPTVGDGRDEADNAFTATLSNPVNATIDPTANMATGTIEDADPAPVFSIAGGSAPEGDPVGFTITRTGATDRSTAGELLDQRSLGNRPRRLRHALRHRYLCPGRDVEELRRPDCG